MRLALIACLCLTACARPLTEAERAFADTLHGPTLNADVVRIVDGNGIEGITRPRGPRPYKTCRERLTPREVDPKIRTSTAAFVLYNTVFYNERLYRDDLLPDYPEEMRLTRAMLLAHELTHVWQWQNRDLTGYTPTRSAAEQSRKNDPYLFDLDTEQNFLDYGFEQQASIVEEYVCCRALDPEGARTDRLYALLKPMFPDIDRQSTIRDMTVQLPWKDAETDGICS